MFKEHLRSPSAFSGIRVTRSLVLCAVLCRSLFVLLSFFFWPLCCLSFYLRILITPLVSLPSSYYILIKVLFCIITFVVMYLVMWREPQTMGKKLIKFTSSLPMVGGSLRVLRFLPPLKLVAMI